MPRSMYTKFSSLCFILRARASIAIARIARISYGNSVRPSLRLSVTNWYQFKLTGCGKKVDP